MLNNAWKRIFQDIQQACLLKGQYEKISFLKKVKVGYLLIGLIHKRKDIFSVTF